MFSDRREPQSRVSPRRTRAGGFGAGPRTGTTSARATSAIRPRRARRTLRPTRGASPTVTPRKTHPARPSRRTARSASPRGTRDSQLAGEHGDARGVQTSLGAHGVDPLAQERYRGGFMPVARVDDPARADAPAGGEGGAGEAAASVARISKRARRRAGARRGTRAWVPPTRDACTRARARAADPACDVEQDMVLVGVCVGGDPARALFGAFFSKRLH